MAIVFAAIAWRHADGEPVSELSVDVQRPPARDGAPAVVSPPRYGVYAAAHGSCPELHT